MKKISEVAPFKGIDLIKSLRNDVPAAEKIIDIITPEELIKTSKNFDLIWSIAKSGSVKVLETLHAKCPELFDNIKDSTTLWSPIYEGHDKMVACLLSIKPTLIDTVFDGGGTALHKAAHLECPRIGKYLLATKPTLIDCVDDNGNTALHLAALEGHERTVNSLLAAKASVDIVNKKKHTVLYYAVMCRNGDIVTNILLPKVSVDVALEELDTRYEKWASFRIKFEKVIIQGCKELLNHLPGNLAKTTCEYIIESNDTIKNVFAPVVQEKNAQMLTVPYTRTSSNSKELALVVPEVQAMAQEFNSDNSSLTLYVIGEDV